MSVDIVTVGFCPQYFSTFAVKGSGTNWYTVSFNGGEGPAHCTCPAFKYSGEPGNQTCKHIRRVWKYGCFYNPQWKDAGPNDLEKHDIKILETDMGNWHENCPGCNQVMVAVKIAV